MVSRTTKVLAAGFVLAIGFGLAWPFRRSGLAEAETKPPAALVKTTAIHSAGTMRSSSAPASVSAKFAADSTLARPAEIRPSDATHREASDSLKSPGSSESLPVEKPTDSAPQGLPADLSIIAEDQPPAERIHVVHDGDSLERLAERYLGDEGRALEIFDLNRGTLENPHWLPIGAELRIPPRPESDEN